MANYFRQQDVKRCFLNTILLETWWINIFTCYWNLKRFGPEGTDCTPRNSSKETAQVQHKSWIFARLVTGFAARKSRGKRFERILPWQAGGSVDWRWVACPSWPSRLHHPNTLSTAFLERVSSPLSVIRNSLLSSSSSFSWISRSLSPSLV